MENHENMTDPFNIAIEQALSLHQAEVNGLAARLQQQYEVSEVRKRRISELEGQLRGMLQTVARAKEKIIAQRDENAELRKLLKRATPESTERQLPPELAESANQSGNDRGSPSHGGTDRRRVRTSIRPMNRTCVSLFSETLDATSLSETDGSRAGESHDQSQNVTSVGSAAGIEADSADFNSSEDSSIILIEAVTQLPNTSGQPRGSASLQLQGARSREEVGGAEKDRGSCDEGCDVTVAAVEARLGSETGSETGSESDPDTRPHSVATSTTQVGHDNPKLLSQPHRPLSLRDGASRVRYKYKELGSQGSSSSTNQATAVAPVSVLSQTATSDVNVSRDISREMSPEADLQDSLSSSRSDSVSPSLLRNSGSPWKQPPPGQPLPMAPSLPDIAPSAFNTPAMPVRYSFAAAVTDTVPRLGIPNSDSQLSLDVSETMPMSPELCSTRNRVEPASEVIFLDDQDSLILCRQMDNGCSKPKSPNVHSGSVKPPPPTTQASRLRSNQKEVKRPSRRKSKTLEEVARQLKNRQHVSSTGDTPPRQVEIRSGRLKLTVHRHAPSVVSETPVCPTVLPVTPGLKPTTNIPAAIWADRGDAVTTTTTMTVRGTEQHGSGQDADGQDSDCEELPLPSKRPHLMAEEENSTAVIKRDRDPRSYEMEDDNDETRLPGKDTVEVTYIDTDSSLSSVDDDRGLLEGETVDNASIVSPSILENRLHSRAAVMREGWVNGSQGSANEPAAVGTANVADIAGEGGNSISKSDHDQHLRRLVARAGLPTYKFVAPIRGRADRDRLDAKACPDCQAWYDGKDGIHRDPRDHLRRTCRHKALHLPPDEDERMWDISFPNTEECEERMHGKL